MRLGVSLPTAYLSGDDHAGKEDRCWSEMFGSAERCLADLAELGVSAVELRDARAVPDPATLHLATDAVYRAGMNATVHLWLPNFQDHSGLPVNLSAADEALRRHDPTSPSPSAMHSHDRRDFATTEDALAQTARDLKQLCNLLERTGAALSPSLELCRFKDDGPVGTSFAELCHIADLAGCEALGFCWDVGHGLANQQSYGASIVPPEGFVTKVTHTHIHDLDGRGRTHGPLTSQDSPIAQMVRLLAENDYGGIYNLELEPTRWSDDAGARREKVETSVLTLGRILG